MPQPHDVVFFESSAQLRKWFEANHDTAAELWLGYHLKRSGRPSVTWQDAVDQELCFGWIDSVRYSLGNDTTAQRLTPRMRTGPEGSTPRPRPRSACESERGSSSRRSRRPTGRRCRSGS